MGDLDPAALGMWRDWRGWQKAETHSRSHQTGEWGRQPLFETGSQKRRGGGRTDFVYGPELQAGVGEEESPVPAARHIWGRLEHLAELTYKRHTTHLPALRCLHDPHVSYALRVRLRVVVGDPPSSPPPLL